MRPRRPGEELAVDPEGTTAILGDFLRRELQRTGLKRFVVGLSGGVDSAVSTYLAARALGADGVHAVLMPYRTSNPQSEADARKVVEQLGLSSERVEITPMVDGFAAASGEVGAHRLGNVMARTRMIVLYDRSMDHDALVLGTSNKTELLLGYGTLHGDMASALNPIGDLYKGQVFQLAEYLGVPESIRTKPPSADLWPDQTDEQELGLDYPTADRLLHLLVDARIRPETLVREHGFDADLVASIERRMIRNQFKRMPPVIAKVSLRSIGWDFRYPRDWRT